MSAEFPLTLLLQIQDDMSSQLSGISSQVGELQTAADDAATSTSNLGNSARTAGPSFTSLGLGIAAAAGGVLNLVRQYHNLQRAQSNIANMQRREENATLTLKNAKVALATAIKKHGKHSKEAEKAQRALTKAENNAESATTRLKSAQVALNDRITDFAFSIGPSVVGVAAGLAQIFQVASGNRGIGGFGLAMGKLLGPLAILGVALLAIKTNFLGARDAIMNLGFQIGQAVPALQPLLNAILDLGILLGIIPGNTAKAGKLLNGFLKDAAAFGQKAFDEISKLAQMFISGNIAGAIERIKADFDKLFPGIKAEIQKFLDNPIEVLTSLVIGIKDWVLSQKIGGFSIDQWITGLGVEYAAMINSGVNPVTAAITLFTNVVDTVMDALLPAQVQQVYDNFTAEWDKSKGQNAAKIIVPVIVQGIELVQPGLLGAFTQLRTDIDNFFKNPTAAGLAQIPVDLGSFLGQLIAFVNPAVDISTKIQDAIAGFLTPVFRSGIVKAWANLNATISGAIFDFTQIAQTFAANLGNAIIQGVGLLTDLGTRILTPIIGFINSAIGPFIAQVISVGEPIAAAIGNAIITGIGKLTDIGTRILAPVLGFINKAIGPFVAKLLSFGEQVAAGIGNAILQGIGKLTDLGTRVISALVGILDNALSKSAEFINWGITIVEAIINAILSAFGVKEIKIPRLQVTAATVDVTPQKVLFGGGGPEFGSGSGGSSLPLPPNTPMCTDTNGKPIPCGRGDGNMPGMNPSGTDFLQHPVDLQQVNPANNQTPQFDIMAQQLNQLKINIDALIQSITQWVAANNVLTPTILLINSNLILLNANMLLFNASMLLLNPALILLNTNLLLLNANMLLLNPAILLLNTNLLLLNANMLLVNPAILLLNTNLLLLNAQMLLLNPAVLLLNTNLLLLNANLLLLNANLVLLNPALVLLNTNMILVIASTVLWTAANNILAVTINQVTINVNALIAANNTLAQTINQVTINTNAWTAANAACTASLKALAQAAIAAAKASIALASASKSATSAMNSAASAANSLASSYKAAAKAAIALAAAQKKIGGGGGGGPGKAKGGLMSAATGKMFTTKGEQQITIGDNPGGRETVAFIPHNNPGPTLDKISRMFAGTQLQGGNGRDVSLHGGNTGGMVIQVFLDGQQIKGKIVSMLSTDSGAFK